MVKVTTGSRLALQKIIDPKRAPMMDRLLRRKQAEAWYQGHDAARFGDPRTRNPYTQRKKS